MSNMNFVRLYNKYDFLKYIYIALKTPFNVTLFLYESKKIKTTKVTNELMLKYQKNTLIRDVGDSKNVLGRYLIALIIKKAPQIRLNYKL